MTARFVVISLLVIAWLASGAGITPASASALAVTAGPTPYTHSFTCPKTLLPQPPNTQVACS